MKTILLTGATDGIGYETAKRFAKEGHRLIIHGRNPEKLEKVKEELLEMNQNIDTVIADLSVLKSAKKMAEEILSKYDVIDIIINNAGVFVMQSSETSEGLDTRFAVNTISPYILSKMLLPILSDKGRIVNLSSRAQSEVDFAAVKSDRGLEDYAAYSQSKLAITMWSMEMAEELGDKAVVVSINPKSFLGSKMVKEAFQKEGFDLSIGADILYRAALSDEFADKTGSYFDNDNEVFDAPHDFAMVKGNRVELVKVMNEVIEKIIG